MTKPRKIKILSVEDDEFMKIFIKNVFWIHDEKKNFELNLTDNMEDARKFLKSKKNMPDMVLLDLGVPEKKGEQSKNTATGLVFLEEIKKNPQTKGVKVIIFSGFVEGDIRKRALALGADKVLVKGEDMPKELFGIINQSLSLPT